MDFTSENLADLIDKANSGNQEAIKTLQQFESDLRMMVRVRLPRPLRSQFDSMDIVQDVWQSFFKILSQQPERFAEIRDLKGYLYRVVQNKVNEENRRSHTQKYDLERQVPLVHKKGKHELPRDVVAPDPSPSQNAQARERLDRLLAGRTAQEANIIELRSQGLTFEEIAEKIGRHERTVRRFFDTIKRDMDLTNDP